MAERNLEQDAQIVESLTEDVRREINTPATISDRVDAIVRSRYGNEQIMKIITDVKRAACLEGAALGMRFENGEEVEVNGVSLSQLIAEKRGTVVEPEKRRLSIREYIGALWWLGK